MVFSDLSLILPVLMDTRIPEHKHVLSNEDQCILGLVFYRSQSGYTVTVVNRVNLKFPVPTGTRNDW